MPARHRVRVGLFWLKADKSLGATPSEAKVFKHRATALAWARKAKTYWGRSVYINTAYPARENRRTKETPVANPLPVRKRR